MAGQDTNFRAALRQAATIRTNWKTACIGIIGIFVALELTIRTKASTIDHDAALGLFRILARQDLQENVLLAPEGVEAAIGLLAEGATGETENQLRAMIPKREGGLWMRRDDPAASHDDLNGEVGAVYHFRSCIWSPPQLHFSDTFRKISEVNFGATIISSAPDQAEKLLNDWARAATDGLIQKIIDYTPLSDGLVLANAVAFAGKWATPFDPALTKSSPFYGADGQIQTAPMMARMGHFRHLSLTDGQVADFLYGDGHFGFTIFVPNAPDGLESWIDRLDMPSWRKITADLRDETGEVRLPHLDLAFEIDLKDTLAEQGVRAAFRPGEANFSPMTTEANALFVGSFVHRVVVHLDESGTKAAATTTISMPTSAVPFNPFTMIADHPFFFAIHGASLEDLLFVGAVRKL